MGSTSWPGRRCSRWSCSPARPYRSASCSRRLTRRSPAGRDRLPHMLRYLTAGESHGPALVATIDGIPSHVLVTSSDIRRQLARRRLGVGRGARMAFEADEVTILAGIRHGETLGSPIAIEVGNTESVSYTHLRAHETDSYLV